MPQGYYTIEQWKRPRKGESPAWVSILTLPFGTTLTRAEQALAHLDRPGFYRIVQLQRVIWAERDGGTLHLRKSHAGSPESLDHMRQMFDRCGGQYPHEEVRAARRKAREDRTR
jgi:hypothetical protein